MGAVNQKDPKCWEPARKESTSGKVAEVKGPDWCVRMDMRPHTGSAGASVPRAESALLHCAFSLLF